MSTRVGTLQAPRAGGSILLAAFLAAVVMLTIAMAAISFDRTQGRQGEATFMGRELVNTPSQLSAGNVGGTAGKGVTNTAPPPHRTGAWPSSAFEASPALEHFLHPAALSRPDPTELSGGISHKYVSDKLGTNTPTELSGGIIAHGRRR